jgi:hypothetical protein
VHFLCVLNSPKNSKCSANNIVTKNKNDKIPQKTNCCKKQENLGKNNVNRFCEVFRISLADFAKYEIKLYDHPSDKGTVGHWSAGNWKPCHFKGQEIRLNLFI